MTLIPNNGKLIQIKVFKEDLVIVFLLISLIFYNFKEEEIGIGH